MSYNLWICCNARTGSNYLCSLLNNTNQFKEYKDKKSFGEWIRWLTKSEFYEKPLENTKMIFEHLSKKLGNITAESIKKILPNTKFVHLKRDNKLEHLASLYFARFTQSYYLSHTNQIDWYFGLPVKFHPVLIETLYEEIIDYQTNWDVFLSNTDYLSVTYEDLIAQPEQTLKGVLEYCGKNTSNLTIKSDFVKMTRPELPNFIKYAREVLLKKML